LELTEKASSSLPKLTIVTTYVRVPPGGADAEVGEIEMLTPRLGWVDGVGVAGGEGGGGATVAWATQLAEPLAEGSASDVATRPIRSSSLSAAPPGMVTLSVA
jgi:hypothetical protein